MTKRMRFSTAVLLVTAMLASIACMQTNPQLVTTVETPQDLLVAEIGTELRENVQIAPGVPVPVTVPSGLQVAPMDSPVAFACLLDVDLCAEAFNNNPRPCLIRAEQCGGNPRVIPLRMTH